MGDKKVQDNTQVQDKDVIRDKNGDIVRKRCEHCGRLLPIEKFQKVKGGSGVNSICNPCIKKKLNDTYERERQATLENKTYQKAETAKQQHIKRILKRIDEGQKFNELQL